MELQCCLIGAYTQFDTTGVPKHIAFPVMLVTGFPMFLMER